MKGQTLIEILVALGVGVMVLSAIAIATIIGLTNAQFSKNQNLATQFAQEGIEKARNLRDTGGWSNFISIYTGCWCYGGKLGTEEGSLEKLAACPVSADTPPSCPQNTPKLSETEQGPYRRALKFVLNRPANDTMTVTSYTSWESRAGRHDARLVSNFTKQQVVGALPTLIPITQSVCSDQSLAVNPNPTPGVRGTRSIYMTMCDGAEPRDNAAALCRAGRSYLCDAYATRDNSNQFPARYWLAGSLANICPGCWCPPSGPCPPVPPGTCNKEYNPGPGNEGFITGGGRGYYVTDSCGSPQSDEWGYFKNANKNTLFGALCCSASP